MWEEFIEEKIREIREKVGNKKAVVALSGGVDSSVCAVLGKKALGDKLIGIYIDTGLMDSESVRNVEILKRDFGINVIKEDRSRDFFNALKGVIDPERKRKIVGELFIKIFEEIASSLGADYLIQGTIAPDWIESERGIKSYHNVGGLPERLKLKILEPLRDLYKDEVRELAKELGLPDSICLKEPFPGPGFSIRVIGEVTPDKVKIVRKCTEIVQEEIKRAGIRPWQAFAVLLPFKSVGVQGDVRAYKQVVAIRIVDSVDGMTANFTEVPHEVLRRISFRITSEVPEVGRVLFDITDKPPATIEFE